MAIAINENRKIFTLHTKNTSYQMMVDSYGFLLHLYYGKKSVGEMDFLLTYSDRGFSGNVYDTGEVRTYSMDALPQEFPTRGTGDYRSPAFDVRYEDGSYGCDLRFSNYRLLKGKYSLPGLPAVYAKETEADTLEIELEDSIAGITVVLSYGVLEKCDVITRAVKVVNHGTKEIYLEKVQSACLDFVTGDFDWISFYGKHAMERKYQRTHVTHGSQKIGSKRGTSSHHYNPVLILTDKDATEDYGKCYGMTFVYSGSFQAEIEKDSYDQTRMLMGLQEEQFSYPLSPGEEFQAPEVIFTYSNQGLEKLTHNMHRCIKEHICRKNLNSEARPILINSWEAAYFNITGESILNLAKEASELGIDMVVMDDGWFGKRDDDISGLGDWYVNEEKLGCSLGELIDSVHGLGMKFGIWVEPEMINEDSDLYRSHPDWALCMPGRNPIRSRYQLVLDFSRKEVVDYIYTEICKVLDQGHVDYLKWDMNRSIADVYTYGNLKQGKVLYEYMLGVYRLLELFSQRYPDMLIEGCSGGGGRFDAGMLYYTPQIWCSDNTDAINRVKIQYGTSFAYPVSAVGSHVSDVPNHQTCRVTSMETRGIVAMAGTFGYELDPARLSKEEKEIIKTQIQEYKKYAELIHEGLYYRLTNPYDDVVAAWSMVSEDKSEALICAVLLEIEGNMSAQYIRAKGLDSQCLYRDVETGKVYPSDVIMEIGLPIESPMEEYASYKWHLEKVK